MSEIPNDPLAPELPPPLDSKVTDTGLSPTLSAGLACIFPLVGGIVFYLLEKRNAYVRFYALQSIYFCALSFLFSTAVTILGTILAHIPIIGWIGALLLGLGSMLVSLIFFVFWIVQIVKAFSGKEWKCPLSGSMPASI